MKKYPHIWEYIQWPGVVSLLALASGWVAVVWLIVGEPLLGIVFAITAFFLDCLDGYVARKLNQVSEFGKQLDGMADFFNYIVFSALLFWLYILPGVWGLIVAFVILATGMLRLIRNNLEGMHIAKDVKFYSGVVVCHILLIVVVLYLIGQFYPNIMTVIAVPTVFIGSILQLSRIPTPKHHTASWVVIGVILLAMSLALLK